MYEVRSYRHQIKDNELVSFTVKVKETDLYIRATRDISGQAIQAIKKYRRPVEQYIKLHPLFLHSLEPVSVEENAAVIIRIMSEAGRAAAVGPMAAVAGAIAEAVGRDLLQYSDEIIVENGGDIFIKTKKKRIVGVFAGSSRLSQKLALEIDPDIMPVGVCTSSGTVGPSFSMGSADAAVVIARSTALADAAATAVGNYIRGESDIEVALKQGQSIKGILGIVIVKGDKMGAWGDIKLVRV